MDDEKLERTIQFIIENQAQFTVDIQKLQEAHKDSEKRLNQLERAAIGLCNAMTDLTKNVEDQTKNVSQLTADIKELRAAQKETDERLNAVILMVERYLSGENGKAK